MNWLTFVGEGRSGHTILSAIIGSHPNVRLGEEQKYIGKWYRNSWTKEQIIEHLMKSGLGKERKKFGLPGILEHKEPLLLLGDKCGWDAANTVRKNDAPTTILRDFGKFMEMPVKTLVSLRHPLDHISNWIVSPKKIRAYPDKNFRFRKMIRRYKRFHDIVLKIIEKQDTYYLYNEILISDPLKTITDLANWLELPVEDKWLKMCSDKVFKKPNRRREQLIWPEEHKQRVLDYINTCPLLEYYRTR